MYHGESKCRARFINIVCQGELLYVIALLLTIVLWSSPLLVYHTSGDI